VRAQCATRKGGRRPPGEGARRGSVAARQRRAGAEGPFSPSATVRREEAEVLRCRFSSHHCLPGRRVAGMRLGKEERGARHSLESSG
jgi:hypothetical protein